MPIANQNLSAGRIDFSKSLTRKEIDQLVADPELEILQFSEPVDLATLEMLDDELFSVRPDVELRAYGFYSSKCDLSFLEYMPNVRRFVADCLMKAKGIEHVAVLRNLESLTIGIYDLDNFDFLSSLPETKLRELSLGETKSKKPVLGSLERFSQLRKLTIVGHPKEIEVVSTLAGLEDLTLCSITVGDMNFLRPLKKLWSLDIKRGGSNNLAALAAMDGIKYLELWNIRGLKDIGFLSRMLGLQFLFLQSLSNITSIPDLSQLTALRRIYLENMKGLRDLDELARAPALQELIHVNAQGMEPEHYARCLKSKTLRRILVGFGSIKKNQAFCDIANRAGIQEYSGSDFQFI